MALDPSRRGPSSVYSHLWAQERWLRHRWWQFESIVWEGNKEIAGNTTMKLIIRIISTIWNRHLSWAGHPSNMLCKWGIRHFGTLPSPPCFSHRFAKLLRLMSSNQSSNTHPHPTQPQEWLLCWRVLWYSLSWRWTLMECVGPMKLQGLRPAFLSTFCSWQCRLRQFYRWTLHPRMKEGPWSLL